MGFIEKRSGKYRARYRDASGRQRSKTFTLKADAERFIREEEVALERGSWIDPRAADMTLGEWCERFMSPARRLAATTQQTYRRDRRRYVLPKVRLLLPRPAARRGDRGVAAGRDRCRHRPVVGAPPLPHAARGLGGGGQHKRIAANPCAGVQPPSVPRRRMVILEWPQVVSLAGGLRTGTGR
jgi:hypothetical protein